MAEVVGGKALEAVVTKVTDGAVDSLWCQIGYVWNYKSNICDLEKQLKVVKSKRESMEDSIKEAKQKGESVHLEATIWCESADAAIQAADDLLAEHGAANKSCFMGYCPNLMTRHHFSRKAKKETMPSLDKVKQDRAFISEISHPMNVQKLELPPPTNFLTLGSRMKIMEEILGALESHDVNLVGVYGLPGVGKTTLVKQQVVAHVREKNIFKEVAIVNVTHPWKLSEIQREIAEWLGLEFRGASTDVRAAQLCARLKQEEKVLIILDNVQRRIPLEEIGIPEIKNHKGCKILVTSRHLKVLSMMGVQRRFQLPVLEQEEARQLFETNTGDFRDSRKKIAHDVADRCLGLPVLIVAVATSLRDKELYEWIDALKQMQKFDHKEMDDKVYSALALEANTESFLGHWEDAGDRRQDFDYEGMDDKSILVGPWGGHGGTDWNDGIFTGVREITLVYDHCIDSIQVVYDKNGKPFSSEKHGGVGGTKTEKIELLFPEEFLVSVCGYYCPVVDGGSPVIRSITLKSNKKKNIWTVWIRRRNTIYTVHEWSFNCGVYGEKWLVLRCYRVSIILFSLY